MGVKPSSSHQKHPLTITTFPTPESGLAKASACSLQHPQQHPDGSHGDVHVCRGKYTVFHQVELVNLISVRKVLKACKVSLKVLLEMILLYKSKTAQVT